MEIKEIHFLIVGFAAIFLLSFFYEGAITGNAVKQAYCDEKGCYPFCEKPTDCLSSDVCCDNSFGSGICKNSLECDKLYFDYDENTAGLASFSLEKYYPGNLGKNRIYLYLIAGVALIIILFLLFGKKKHSQDTKTEAIKPVAEKKKQEIPKVEMKLKIPEMKKK
jgi:hypothetical protein